MAALIRARRPRSAHHDHHDGAVVEAAAIEEVAPVTEAVVTVAPPVAVAVVLNLGRDGCRSRACCADRDATGHQYADSGDRGETPRALCIHGHTFLPSLVRFPKHE